MGLLDLFSGKNKNEETDFILWIPLIDISQLTEIVGNSNNVSVIFKHSTRCGISRGVMNKFEKKHQNIDKEIQFYYLDLLNFREISNEIATRFKVVHQSPQLILFKNGCVEAHASHYDILELEI